MDDRFGRYRQSADYQADVVEGQKSDVSVWLYLGALCATLSGLYAVNFSLGDANFANLTYGLALIGYLFSFVVRIRNVDLDSIKLPLIISGALLVLAYVSGSGTGWLIPSGATSSLGTEMQVLVTWIAILHTFMLFNDASVLFACVPGMAMLALVSTLSPEQEVQNAFLMFVSSATFMMVHENYLRTRNAKTLRQGGVMRPLFGAQLLLTGVCLVGALLLSNILAVPIKTIGQSLFNASLTPLGGESIRQKAENALLLSVNEQTTLNLATGGGSESDTPLLRIQSPRGMYWRGTTFSTYTGSSFDNRQQSAPMSLEGAKQSEAPVIKQRQMTPLNGPNSIGDKYVFKVPTGLYDLPPSDMKGSYEERQIVQVIGGANYNLYGAATVREITTSLTELKTNTAGALIGTVPVNAYYEVVSQVPTLDEKKLRQASSSLEDVPTPLQAAYLQIPDTREEDKTRLKQLALTITKDKKNNFDKAEALRKYIAAECKYNLQAAAAPHDRDIVAWFLFEKKEGYCDSFAAAMTMLCRYAGIPARLVSGFLPGDLETENVYIVREKHKHAWTEVYFPHIGWVPFDATDGSVDITDRSHGTKKQQTNFVKWLMSHGSMSFAVIVTLVIMLGYVVKTEVLDRFRGERLAPPDAPIRPPTNLQIIEAYRQAESLLRRRGIPRLPYQTPDEYGEQLTQRLEPVLSDVSRSMAELTALYTHFRYGRETATTEEVVRAQTLAASLQTQLQAVKGNLAPDRSPDGAKRSGEGRA